MHAAAVGEGPDPKEAIGIPVRRLEPRASIVDRRGLREVSMAPPPRVVAIYGGSFNPPHVGHALVAQWVLWTGRADAVWLLPVYRHAFEGRHDKVLATFEDRVRWCEALAADLGAGVEVSTVEATLPPPSYTVRTLEHFARTHPATRFRLIIGADSVPHLPAWHRWATIEAEFDPIVVGRQGYAAPPGHPSVDFPNVSSTELRRRLANGEVVDHLLTRRVAAALAPAAQSGDGGR